MPAQPIRTTVTRSYPSSPERLFGAWLDPEQAGRFLFATPGGEMIRVEIDPVVGGRFTIVERRDGKDWEHVGEYVEIDRPRWLVFRFGVPAISPGMDRVTIAVDGLAEGGCRLTLTAEMAPEFAEFEERSRAGWTMILESLARAVP
jgi:uncharacterized protein YndB with AHSA1/START domain